jgi:aromatic-L-amino-acid decarboxylase
MPEHMSPDEFRKNGHAVVEWVASYLERVDEFPVFSTVQPGDIARMLPDHAPEEPEAFDRLLADLDDVVVPGLTHWQSPNWFAYFPANSSPPSILAELASAGLGVQGMLWSTSPAATEVESRVLDWLVDLMGLPQEWKSSGPGGGVIQMSASDATHIVLVVARHRNREQAAAEDMVVYASSQAHSSVEKGCTIAGIGHLRVVDVDEEFAMDAASLQTMVDADREAGLTPIAVVSVIGTTGTTAVDPIAQIGRIATRHGLWHHVDAAYAGTAMLAPEFRHHQDGVESVDSYSFNPHKWMMVNFDCSVLWVADRRPLIDTLSILPPYLRDGTSDDVGNIDYRDWHVPLGRRFRALKLWWVIRSYGAEGIRAVVRDHVRLADDLAVRLEADDRFELVAPHPFALVCFLHRNGNDPTRDLAEAMNASGSVAVTHTSVAGTDFVRVSIGQTHTGQEHVDALWSLIDELAPDVDLK